MNQKSDSLKKVGLMYSILTNNAYHSKTPAIKSTGFRTPFIHYNEREEFHNLAESFLINSYLKRNDAEIENSISSYLGNEGTRMISLIGENDLSAYDVISLHQGNPLDLSLSETMSRRRSIRDFTGDPLRIETLATLLRATAGVSALAETNISENESIQFKLRTVPSGGGLYPIDLYFAVINVNGILPGLYQYHPAQDQLTIMGDKKKMDVLLASFSGHIDMVNSSHASLILLYVARPWRSMRKYGIRGLRFVFQEIGGMSQNTHLAVAAIGLGSVDCASFFEDEANKALNLDGLYQTLLHSILIGTIA